MKTIAEEKIHNMIMELRHEIITAPRDADAKRLAHVADLLESALRKWGTA